MLPKLLPVYQMLFNKLDSLDIKWIQVDEPILVTELDHEWQAAFKTAYQTLSTQSTKLLVATYFGRLKDNLSLLLSLPVDGFHIDAIRGKSEIDTVLAQLSPDKVLSLGVINGRNIWKTDLNKLLNYLEPIAKKLQDRLWLAPSCSLLHVPIDLSIEDKIDPEILNWLAFAKQKLVELSVLQQALKEGRNSVKEQLQENQKALDSRQYSKRVHSADIKAKVQKITKADGKRTHPYKVREEIQKIHFNLPLYPTTTIGSFPQTPDIRKARLEYKKGVIDQRVYEEKMKREIEYAIHQQEELGLDVLVHGEAERNDMVEYFGEQLEGYVFSQFGWVQSYGSRCVKPPILYGDIKRPHAMTVFWSKYAQSLTKRPMKGMLTGPVTILNWSFVRDDQSRQESCFQLALAMREEVLDLEKAGINIIQIDEAALREGLPLRRSEWQGYLDWAIESFRITANGVKDETQIHTHMCYSEFNDIIDSIAHMDADIITIETSRSDMELLEVFENFKYPNQIGPGVYDIHSPNIPTKEEIVHLMGQAVQYIPAEKLWINPDCGLKTRRWEEVMPALKNMVDAAKILRE